MVNGTVLEIGFSIISQASTLGSLYLQSIWIGSSPSLPTSNSLDAETGIETGAEAGKRMGGSSVLGDERSILIKGEQGDVGDVTIEGNFVVEEGQLEEILSWGSANEDDDVVDSEKEAVSLVA